MINNELDRPQTPRDLYDQVVRGGDRARDAFEELTTMANGGAVEPRQLVNELDAAIAQGEVKLPPVKETTKRKQGLLGKLDELLPRKDHRSPDNF